MLTNRQSGVSLIELMVAVAMALVISIALGTIFVNTSKAKQEVQRTHEQIENGRLAMDYLLQEVRMAGFWDGLEFTALASPGTMPDICERTDLAKLKAAVPLFLQGDDDESVGSLGCLTDRRPGTDAIIIRRAGTCAVGAAGDDCEDVAPYFQASACRPPYTKNNDPHANTQGTAALNTELASPDTNNWYALSNAFDAVSMPLLKRFCGAPLASIPEANPPTSPVRRYIARIFYVANSDRAGDNLPSLKVAELRNGAWQISTVASGIEQLQVEYGVDVSGDTAPEAYVLPDGSRPAAAAGAASPFGTNEWRRITAVRLHVLARNSSPSPQFTNNRIYTLGSKKDGSAKTVGPFADQIRRQVFTSQTGLPNPSGMRGG